MKLASFANIGLPIGWDPPLEVTDAAGVMVGYLMLDALVSNQDRHHENRGVVSVSESDFGVFFAPTFDHASSLGCNETDASRRERLNTKDSGRSVEAYVERAKSAFYLTNTSAKPLTTLDAFSEAAKIRPEAGCYWQSRLAAISRNCVRHVLIEVPDAEISAAARDFACRMIKINAKRILNIKIESK